jgi:Carboxypeptidase regulatory-like domain
MCRVFAAAVLVVPLVMAGPRSSPASAQTGTQTTGPRGTVTSQAPAGTAVLRGTVVAADTGTPLRRVLVRAQAAEAQDIKAATTDDQGRFEIRELAGGRYTITAQKTGYVTLSYGQRRVGERGTVVAVPAGQTVEKIALALPRGGVITGRVSDEFGEPLAEAMVQVQRYRYMPGGRRLMPVGRPDTTDDQGTFRLYGLEPGDYVISATVRNASGMVMVGGRPAPESDQGYAPTYFPGTPSQQDAQRVTVAPGQEVSGIAFALTPTRVARISGRVTGGPEGVAAEGYVMIRPEEGFTSGMVPGGTVQADGTFEIAGVPPGRYVLQLQPRQRGDNDLVGVTTVTVAGEDLQNLVITLQRPGSVSGRFEFEGGPPAGLSPTMVRFMPLPANPGSSSFMMSSLPQTNADYSFRGQGFLGSVLLRASAPSGWYVAAILHGADDVTDTPLRLGPGIDVRDVRILLTQTATTLSGTVRDDRGSPVVDATVVVFPDDEKWNFGSRHLRTLRPDTQGHFETRGLPPASTYRIVAVQGLEDGQAYDPEFLTSVRDRADRLTLTPGESKAVDLRLRP